MRLWNSALGVGSEGPDKSTKRRTATFQLRLAPALLTYSYTLHSSELLNPDRPARGARPVLMLVGSSFSPRAPLQ